MSTRFFIALPLLLAATPALAAGPVQDTIALDRAVAAFTGRPIGAEGGARTPIDPRLRLARCAMVALAWRAETHDAVVVRCSEPEWRMFVPVRLAAPAVKAPVSPGGAPVQAAVEKPVIVIRRGDPVTISAGSPGFSITREGLAAGDAAAGARFLVRIDDQRAPIQAVAIASGRATLPGWTE